MLSGETTTGKFPSETVKYMADICEEAEKHQEYSINIECTSNDIAGAIATSVVETSNLLDAKLIVAATMSGLTPRLISNLRPKSLILATTPFEGVARSLALNAGVYPLITKEYESTDEIVNDAIVKSKEFVSINKDDLLIITGGFPNNAKTTNFMKIEKM
jgi:pyruvate kinase